jgi:hypothetical protein
MGTYLVLERLRKTQLKYYLVSYFAAAISFAVLLLGGDFSLKIVTILSMFVLGGATVPIACWWLYYRVLV